MRAVFMFLLRINSKTEVLYDVSQLWYSCLIIKKNYEALNILYLLASHSFICVLLSEGYWRLESRLVAQWWLRKCYLPSDQQWSSDPCLKCAAKHLLQQPRDTPGPGTLWSVILCDHHSWTSVMPNILSVCS